MPPGEQPSHVAALLRPADLVALEVLGYGLTDGPTDGAPAVVAGPDGGRLEVLLPFQHVQEETYSEQAVTGPPPTGLAQVRAAGPSRLVFDVPAGTRITWTTAGILGVLPGLMLRVVPLALPAPEPPRLDLGDLLAHLPGLVVRVSDGGQVVALDPAASVAGRLRVGVRGRAALLRRVSATGLPPVVVDDDATLRHLARHGVPAVLQKHVLRPDLVLPQLHRRPREPKADETAIEAPYRLVLSPSALARFVHAAEPVLDSGQDGGPERVELWHTRLDVRQLPRQEEPPAGQRVVRAVWHREGPGSPRSGSLGRLERDALVRQSADPRLAVPAPVAADALHLTSLGATLDLHGAWDTAPYAQDATVTVSSWDHRAQLGRDLYVRVAFPGYLFPFGHRATLVKVTERKIAAVGPGTPTARLYTRFFLVVDELSVAYPADRTLLPFTRVEVNPRVTPDLAWPSGPEEPVPVFVPELVSGDPFVFTLRALDHEGRSLTLRTPLVFVPETAASPDEVAAAWFPHRRIAALGQTAAFGPAAAESGATAYEVDRFDVTGRALPPPQRTSVPELERAVIRVPAMQHLTPTPEPVTVAYSPLYRQHRFGGDNVAVQALLRLVEEVFVPAGTPPLPDAEAPARIMFPSTDRSGGFVSPDLTVHTLSRAQGAMGDPAAVTGGVLKPQTLLANTLPKLFGLVPLTELLSGLGGLADVPEFLSEQVGPALGVVRDIEALVTALEVAEQRVSAVTAPTGPAQAARLAASQALQALRATVAARHAELDAALDALPTAPDAETVLGQAAAALTPIGAALGDLDAVLRDPVVPPLARAELERLAGGLGVLRAGGDLPGLLASLLRLVQGAEELTQLRARYVWKPRLKQAWPKTDAALLQVAEDSFTLSLEARVAGPDGVAVDVAAELRNFSLNLPPDPARVVSLTFDRLAFRSVTGRKPEVDCVFGGMQWFGPLSFIETLQSIIPFDGFSDPPSLDVSPQGVTAGYQLALPNAAVGVFSLENIALAADVRVPFLGEALTVGFSFCSRERPFRMTVMAIGGGGFVGLRLSPNGLVLLEMALEAGAALSINLGVASGSVSVMVGVYLRLAATDQGDQTVSLTGYLRIRGEVDVLGIISASITLELALEYVPTTGKLTGRASVVVQIHLLFLKKSVAITYERQFAGSNDDPTLAQVLGIDDPGELAPDAPDGGVPAWTQYCAAFAAA